MTTDTCIICGGPAKWSAIYGTDNPEADGLGTPPPGKQRVVLYGLCARHDPSRRVVLILAELEIAKLFGGNGGGK